MPDRLIVNASPLIFLSPVDGLGWLTALSRTPVLIPKAVVSEVLSGADGEAIMEKVKKDARFTDYPRCKKTFECMN